MRSENLGKEGAHLLREAMLSLWLHQELGSLGALGTSWACTYVVLRRNRAVLRKPDCFTRNGWLGSLRYLGIGSDFRLLQPGGRMSR